MKKKEKKPEEDTAHASKEALREGFARMWRLSWITVFYQIGAAVVMALAAGGSQAMKTEWLENALAVIPAAGVLLTYQTENRAATRRHPFGHHRSGTIASLAAAFVLAGIGSYLCIDSALKLIHREHPSIGGITLFGHTLWHGWLMMALMFVTGVPPSILGKMKMPIATLLHDKPLFADAEMNRANWLTNGAGMVGLGLVAWGFWWGDTLAALLISLDILRDGWTSVARSLSDVMDHHPVEIESDEEDGIISTIHRVLRALPFVADERALVREHGRYFFAEIFIQPNEKMPSAAEASRKVRDALKGLDWRLQHLAIEFTDDLDEAARVVTREEIDIEPKGSRKKDEQKEGKA